MTRRHRSAAGFSLIELMTAMLLSLLLIGATISVFVGNKRVYASTEGLGRIQENARIAFELMARDIREAGGNPCDVRMKIVNVLADTANWWATFGAGTDTGVFGYENGSFPGSTAGTDAIQVQFYEDTGLVTSAAMGSDTDDLPLDDTDPIAEQQILMACGFFKSTPSTPVTDTATIFSAGKASGAITHGTDVGNAGETFADATYPMAVVYPANTLIGSLRAMEWYVAVNDKGNNSLYRRQLSFPGAAAPEMGPAEEVVEDVLNMQLAYLEGDTWTTASPSSWNNVTAVQVVLDIEASDNRAGGVQGEMIKRKLTHVIALRNKL